MDQNTDLFVRYFPVLSNHLNPLVVILWRLGLGRLLNLWPAVTGRIMILKHSGRKTGKAIFTPVNYIEREGLIYCAASLGVHSDWYLNILANPQVEVWLPDGWYAGHASVIELQKENLEMLKTVLSSANIASRMTGIDLDLEEEEFALAAVDYKLISIERQSPRTGVNGPGGLAWLWPFILVFLLGMRPKRKR